MKYVRIALILFLAYIVCFVAVGLGEISYNIYKDINDNINSINNRVNLIEYYQSEQYDGFANIVLAQKKVFDDINEYNKKINKIGYLVGKMAQRPSYEYLKSITVRIYQKANEKAEIGGLGTGTIVKMTDDATYILTNKHVATEGHYVVLLDENNEPIVKCEVIKNSDKVDLSLIKAPIKIKDKQVFKGFGTIDYQEQAYSVGMFLGLKYIYTEGAFAGYEEESFLINIPAGPGCSGSGVFNREGKLVAVIYAGNILNYVQMDTARAICVTGQQAQEFLGSLL